MATVYSDAFVEQARAKVLSRGTRTISMVANDLNMSHDTLRGWMSTRKRTNTSPQISSSLGDKHEQIWTLAQQLEALQITHGLSEVQLGAWCRERGLFVHQLEQWKAAFLVAGPATSVGASANTGSEIRVLKDQVNQLKRELHRKDKALAEAGALLVLQKKFRALWADEDNS